MHNNSPGSGWKPEPKTALQWVERWTRSNVMHVPTRGGHVTYVTVENIAPVAPGEVEGEPDLLVTTTAGKRFYVKFMTGRAYKSLDLPLLLFPVDRGADGAFWIMPTNAYLP